MVIEQFLAASFALFSALPRSLVGSARGVGAIVVAVPRNLSGYGRGTLAQAFGHFLLLNIQLQPSLYLIPVFSGNMRMSHRLYVVY